MDIDSNQIFYVLFIVVGILILIYPALVAYIIGLSLIFYGALEIIK